MSQASPGSQMPSPPEGSPPQPPGSRRTTILVVAAAVALVAVPLLTVGLPVEIAHWYLAAAQVNQQAGDIQAAQASLETAVQYAPDDISVHRRRCQILRECDLLEESLAAAGRALELVPGDRATYLQQAQTLMDMQRFSEAVVAIHAAFGSDSDSASSMPPVMLNMLAYARALAGENLSAALEEVNQALQHDPGNAAMLDTRGYILYQLGKHELALDDLEQAVAASDMRRFEQQAEAANQIRSAQQIETRRELATMNLAVMLYHRGLVYEAVGKQQQAEADFAKVRELGFEPGESLY